MIVTVWTRPVRVMIDVIGVGVHVDSDGDSSSEVEVFDEAAEDNTDEAAEDDTDDGAGLRDCVTVTGTDTNCVGGTAGVAVVRI